MKGEGKSVLMLTQTALGRRLAGVVLALSTVCAAPAWAADLVDATKPQELYEIARGWGSATLETDQEGDPVIRGRIEGVAYTIDFYNCA